MDVDAPKRLTLSAKGPGEVRPATSRNRPASTVLNRDHVICHLDDGAELFMGTDRCQWQGYVAADKNRPEDAPIGLIPIDAIFRRSSASATKSPPPARAGAGL